MDRGVRCCGPSRGRRCMARRRQGAGPVRINKGSSALQDGNARIALRARCDANLAAFELDVTVQQGSVIGEVSTGASRRRDLRWRLASCQRRGRPHRRRLLEGACSGLRVPRRVRPERGGSGGEGLGHRTSVTPRSDAPHWFDRLGRCRALRDGTLRFRHHDPERFDDRTTAVLFRGHVHSAQRARTLDLLPRPRLRRRPRGTMGSEGVSHVPIGGRSPGQNHEEQERRSDDREAEHCRLFHARIDTHLARRDNPVQPSEPEPREFHPTAIGYR